MGAHSNFREISKKMIVKESIDDLERLNKGSPMGNIYQSRTFYKAYEKIGWNPFTLEIVNDGECLGGMVAYVPSYVPFFWRLTRTIFVYFGPILRKEAGRPRCCQKNLSCQNLPLIQLLRSLDIKAKALKAARAEIRTPFPYPSNCYSFEKYGYTRSEHEGEFSTKIDLTKSSGNLHSEMRRSCRKRIKKALRKGVEVREVKSLTDLKEFHWVYLETARRRRFFPYPFKFFEVLWRELEPKGTAQFFTAYYRNIPVAIRLNTIYNRKASTFISGSVEEFWHLNSTHLITWHSILYNKEQTDATSFYLTYIPPTNGPSGIDYLMFKTSFGGELVHECSFYKKTFSPLRFHLTRTFGRYVNNLLGSPAQKLRVANWKVLKKNVVSSKWRARAMKGRESERVNKK